jgi:UPF0755 protein
MKLRSRFRRYFVIALLAIVIVGVSVHQFQRFLITPLVLNEVQNLDVPKGSSFAQVIRELAARGVLQQPQLMQLYVRISARGHRIQAGEYLLGPGTTPLDLLDMLERGRVRTHALTLVEGWTLTQMRAHLAKDAFLQHQLKEVPNDKLLAALNLNIPDSMISAADIDNAEGWFFPDTYLFSGATSDRDVLRQAHRRMQQVLAQEWQQRSDNLPYKNPYEALIMASIVERETGVASEREEIAGVFVRRLQRGMLLQTDPTVIYGIEQYDGNLRRKDLQNTDNRYNTYLHAGLPPTPIALPGRAAIRAALHPAAGDALYFVARGDGSHQFSTTLDEHESAVRKYQIEQRRANYSSRPGGDSGSVSTQAAPKRASSKPSNQTNEKQRK